MQAQIGILTSVLDFPAQLTTSFNKSKHSLFFRSETKIGSLADSIYRP